MAMGKEVLDQRQVLNDALNRAVARVWELQAQLRKAQAEERSLRKQLGSIQQPSL